ncbi:MAG: RNA polymerase sigma factor [Actinobacteria bacterium]|nr:RNA polymerase sigma factor [Actinomycetota bacterium]
MAFGEEAFESVLEACKAGAEWAWAAVYRDLAGPVTGYLASRGSAEPEDTTSEVFLKVARNVSNFTGDESSFRSWVFVIAHRTLLDERRNRGRRPSTAEFRAETAAEGGNVESEAMDQLVTDELQAAFDQLTESQRDVLALRMIAGLTVEQTAQVLGKREGAVKALQRRALAALKQIIDLEGVTL